METRRPLVVVIIGPAAVGKMTVGQQLAALTGFPLYYNHRMVDFLTDFFPYGTASFNRLSMAFNRMFFEEAIASRIAFIWTWGWDFAQLRVAEDIREFSARWTETGGAALWAELAAPLEVRLVRNRHEHRRQHKKVDWATDDYLRQLDREHRYNSEGHFPRGIPHLLVDTARMSAVETAAHIRARFAL